MAQIVDMPQLSDTMREGVLRKWRKNEGEKIVPGELFAEVETDKATMDWEAYDEGTLLKKLIPDGATVPVGAPIAILGNPGEDITALIAEAAARSAEKKGGATGGAKAEAKSGATSAPSDNAATNAAAPAAAAPTPAAPAKAANAPASAPAAKPAAAPAGAGPRPAPARPAPANGAKILASPLARRLATDLGIDLRAVSGTGPGGRIVERDVKAAAAAPAAPAPAAVDWHAAEEAPQTRTAAGTAPLPVQLVPDRRTEARPAAPTPSADVEKPLSLMRKTIARRLLESKTTIPHFYLTAEADMDAAMEFREQVIQVHATKLSVNDLVLKAVALAMRKVPEANASFGEDAIILHARVDIGMAVAIEDGLVTPVIRDADKKTLGQIANDARELAARARDRKLRPEEMTGGTVSVSNLGMFGIEHFSAIINPPEAVILAVGTVSKRPVVKGDQIVIGQRMAMTLSCDHRVVDGAVGARLMQAIVAILERPITLAF
jgi:pyruvate dehydrogenase E2 component (dihydrolipoamide acetyltransferase)